MSAIGQTPAARVAQPVDVEQLVTLQGNTHPLARPEFDQGVAPDSLPMQRILLVLQRSEKQNAALHELLEEQQTKSSPDYHLWLTPEQFGQQFGPADADIQAVTDWLTSQGFEVNRVATGRTVIEFSGTAGTVRQTFHTEIHKFLVNGEEHWANASDPKIPAALQPVVAGFASLNNFPRQPMVKLLGAFSRSKSTGVVKPLITVPTNSGNYYVLGPYDFATIYNVLPLWQASPAINGSGQTIAIVASSNINVQDVSDFRGLFGLPFNDPQVIVNGIDPGVTGGEDESEADLDTEWSGAVAPNATIELVVSESTESTFGADLSAVYIVDNNLAPILSASYGACELFLGTGGNAFYNSLWGQGAAQGITVLVASGDGGSALCDAQSGLLFASQGLTVNGTASTPFNVAVGGTDFNDVNTWSTYWSSTNNASTLASALSYIPETTWNDSCARSGTAGSCANADNDTPEGIDLVAGSGGQSNCLTSTGTFPAATCTGGYPKPAWQTGTGVPNDGARDLPDVSLFASNGMNNSFYLVCEADAVPGEVSCDQGSSNWVFLGAGGTSASTPAFAGIMALVDQQTNERQGNANYILYPLAAKPGASCASTANTAGAVNTFNCVFYDVQTGNISVACAYDTPNCSSRNGQNTDPGMLEVNPPANPLPAWNTNAGYDLATGLGSVNAANLVKNWSSVSFNPSKTSLASLSPTTLTHGQAVSFTVNVAPGSGSGTPTGIVSLIAQTGGSSTNAMGIGPFTLTGGTLTSSTNMLPGGTYGVTAHYPGNGTYGASDSTPPIQVTVAPEASETHVALLTFDPITGQETSSNASSAVYGEPTVLRADVTNSSGSNCYSAPYACPTGQLTLSNNGQAVDGGMFELNSEGYTEDQFVLLPGGSNRTVAIYLGDTSYNASTSSPDTITVTPAPTTLTTTGLAPPVVAGNVNFGAGISTQSYGVAPTGTVQVSVDGGPFGYAVPIQGIPYVAVRGAYASGTAQTSQTLTGGPHTITQQYSGDVNYASSTAPPVSITASDYSVSSNPATINIPAPGQSATATIVLTPLYGFTGTVQAQCTFNSISPGLSCSMTPPALASFTLSGSSPVTFTVTISSTAPVSSDTPAPQIKVPPSSNAPAGRHWMPALMLCLLMLMILAAGRERAAALVGAGALLTMGVWIACGGGVGGGGGGSIPPESPAPAVAFSTPGLTFTQQNTGYTSAAQNIILSNTGNATLDISNMGITGTNSGDFAQTSSCGNAVVAQDGCLIGVTFTPSAPGTRTASLTVTDNASGSPQSVSLTGTGVTPAVSFSPPSLAFGQENLNTTTPPRTVMLSNTGSVAINILGMDIPTPYFAETSSCGSSLAAGASCPISVTFTPELAGPLSAQLMVTDSAPGSPHYCNLTGTGVQPTPQGSYTVQIQTWSLTPSADSHLLNIPLTVQ
jgi:hypothetical protein